MFFSFMSRDKRGLEREIFFFVGQAIMVSYFSTLLLYSDLIVLSLKNARRQTRNT